MRIIALVLLLLSATVVRAADGFRVETVVEGLDHPWCLAFLPNGDWLVTQRGGALRVVRDGALLAAPVAGVPAVYAKSQGGLFDVLPDPEFATNRRIYLSFAHGSADANATRVVAARLVDDALVDVEVLFTAAPLKSGPVHYGGRMALGADGKLYLTLGDGFDWREQAQNLDNHFGALVRLNTDGSVPADNPFIGLAAARPEIWSFGHRNAQGLVLDPATGVLWQHEHGPKGGDELNRIQRGANYGWPKATYGLDYSGAVISPFQALPDVTPPLVVWTPSIAPAGLAIYRGELFPEWDGDLFVAALVERGVRRLQMEDGRVSAQHLMFRDLNERIRDVRVGPDGALYLLTDSSAGRILRVAPQ